MDDPDYADNLALLSHTRHDMQEKTSTVADISARLVLKIHTPIMQEGEALDEVESFSYLGSIVDNTGEQKLMEEPALARREQLSNS